jgi:hypothetical protein
MAIDIFSTPYKGISFDFLDDGSYLLNYLVISKNRKKLNIVKSKEQLTHVSEIEDNFNSDDVVQINLLGKGIVYKIFDKKSIAEITDEEKLISMVLPNVDVNDFLMNTYEFNDNVFVAVCRKSFVDEVLVLLKEINCLPIHVFLGPIYFEPMLPYIKHKGTIKLNSYTLKIEQQHISSITKFNNTTDQQYFTLEEDRISSNLLLLFSSVLLLETNSEIQSVKHALIADYKLSILFQKKYKKYLINTAAIFFVVLFLNFVLYSYLYNTTTQYIYTSAEQNKTTEIKNKQIVEYTLNKNFIESKKWNKAHSLVEYIESIVKYCPNGLSINSFNYQIRDKNNRNITDTIYNRIYISGEVINSNQLNNWMKNLSSLNLFKDVKLITYATSNNTSQYSFNLEIEL